MSAQHIAEFYPGFNREVVPVVFMVEGIGFKIDAAILTSHSQFFSDMLASPHIGLEGEGTEEHPIVVTQTTKEEFANFCRWLTHKSWTKLEATREKLMDVLHVSHLFQVTDGINFAIQALDGLSPPLTLCCRLHLAIRYGISSWVDDTVRALLIKPADAYDAEDLAFIGVDALAIVLAAKEKITRTRAGFANYPIEPSTTAEIDEAPFCKRHLKCRRVWVERWFTHLARRIYDTSTPIALEDAPFVLKTMAHPKMNMACKNYNIGLVRQSPKLLDEERFIEETVNRISDLLRD